MENAVVGVTGAPSPMNDRVRPCTRKVDTFGVYATDGRGVAMFERVIVDGVRSFAVVVGDGGKTNNV